LEIDLQGSIERELKGLILCLTHGVCTFQASSAVQTRMNTDEDESRKIDGETSNWKSGINRVAIDVGGRVHMLAFPTGKT